MTRGRRPHIERPSRLEVSLPEDLRTRLDLILFSTLEGRVPHGSYSTFFQARLREFFDTQALDLGPYVAALPGEHVVRASPTTIAALEVALKEKHA